MLVSAMTAAMADTEVMIHIAALLTNIFTLQVTIGLTNVFHAPENTPVPTNVNTHNLVP